LTSDLPCPHWPTPCHLLEDSRTGRVPDEPVRSDHVLQSYKTMNQFSEVSIFYAG
jgi:hypothetical protein